MQLLFRADVFPLEHPPFWKLRRELFPFTAGGWEEALVGIENYKGAISRLYSTPTETKEAL